MIDRQRSVLVTGRTGMIGGEVVKQLGQQGFARVLTPTRAELELTDRENVNQYFEEHRPAYVLMLAAKVGGIAANIRDPVGFTDDNLRITLNLFAACHKFKTHKNLFLGSSCIYPIDQTAPIKEAQLLSGLLEPSNEGYALAKIVGLKLAKYYYEQYGMVTVCPMLSNVYGTGDHFELDRAHVLSALVRRFVEARDAGCPEVLLWGSGIARREFLHSEDAARAVLFFLDHVESPDHINVGAGKDISIFDLADLIARETGYKGAVHWDSSKPDGMLSKCLDTSRLKGIGFQPKVALLEGVRRTISEYEAIKKTGEFDL
jgi:GDP-L-fucose synthase